MDRAEHLKLAPLTAELDLVVLEDSPKIGLVAHAASSSSVVVIR